MGSGTEGTIEDTTVGVLNDWFAAYVGTFKGKDGTADGNILLKEEHTRRVRQEILAIGRALDLSDDDLRLANVIALFHDIGRFEQYARYGTFVDRRSCNHAELGVSILEREGILDHCDPSTGGLILRTIRYHNRAELPREETKRCLFFSRLLRDADKMDIWRVVTDYYHRHEETRNEALELDLPDSPGFSDGVYGDLINERIVDIRNVRSLNDFKLLQVGWVFDLNFDPTVRFLCARGYLDKIRDVLPASEKIDEIFSAVGSYIDRRLQQADHR